jgi:hypothetical protein
MGRTIPSFKLASLEEKRNGMEWNGMEWNGFCRELDKSDRKVLDRLFATVHLYNSASSYVNNPIRIQSIFMSIIFHYYKQLKKLAEIENLTQMHKERKKQY